VIAADTGAPVSVELQGQKLYPKGYQPGFAGSPSETPLLAFDLAATSEGVTGTGKKIELSTQALTSLVIFQKVTPEKDGKPGKRELEIQKITSVGDKPRIEVISFSNQPAVRIQINDTTMGFNRGVSKVLPKLPALKQDQPDSQEAGTSPLRISHDEDELFFESVEAKEHLLIILYDGVDGKLRVAVADA